MPSVRNSAAAALITVALAAPVAAQEDLSSYIVDLDGHDIRDLTLTIRDMAAQTSGMSGTVRDMVAGSGGDIAMRETDDSIVLSVTSDVLFGFDSADLTAPARETLARIATVLAENDGGPVQVVGHTDARGPDAYNQRLSEERAAAVVTFLTASDVPSARLEAGGRGESEPVAPNEVDGADNPDGRAQNRRVEFVLPK